MKKLVIIPTYNEIDDIENLGINVLLCTYYEKKRKSRFSVSHHLIDSCKKIYYLSKKDFLEAKLK